MRYIARLTAAFMAAMLLVGCEKSNTVEEVEYPKVTTDVVTTTMTEAPETTAAETTTKEEITEAPTETTTFADMSEDTHVEYHFRTKKQLEQHFEKHGGEFGSEFGYSTASDYEAGASDVINDPTALYKTEAEDGDGVYYIEETNEFVILSTDGYIRTYFRPSAGKKYFDRQ